MEKNIIGKFFSRFKFDSKEQKKQDSFINRMTGWNGVNNQTENLYFFRSVDIGADELSSLYAQNWLVRRIVDAPVYNMTSQGITFVEEDTEEGGKTNSYKRPQIEKKFKEFEFWAKIKEALKLSRLYGGSLIVFDFGDSPEEPLKENQKKYLKQISVIPRQYAFPHATTYNERIHGSYHPKIGETEHYQVVDYSYRIPKSYSVHETKTIKVDGLYLPPLEKIRNYYWGGSVISSCYTEIKQYISSMAAAATTLQEFTGIEYKMSGLADKLKDGDREFIDSAMGLANTRINSQSLSVCDADEEIRRVSHNVSGLSELIDRFANQMAAASTPAIPHSILFSSEGGALAGSSGVTDVKNYMDRISSMQEEDLRPILEKGIDFLGFDSNSCPFVFNNPMKQTKLEELDERTKVAQVDEIYLRNQVTTPDEIAESRFSESKFNSEKYNIDIEARKEFAKLENEDSYEEEVEEAEELEIKEKKENEKKSI